MLKFIPGYDNDFFFPQVEREKLKSEELITKTAYERSSLDRSLQRLEEDNVEMQRQIQQLQQQLAGK